MLPSPMRAILLPFVLLCVCALAPALRADDAAAADVNGGTSVASAEAGASVDVSALATVWVEVRDGRDRPVTDLAPEDLRLRVDGQAAPVVEVVARGAGDDPAGDVVIYVDRVLAGGGTTRRALEGLADAAGSLAAFGTVTLVVAEPSPAIVFTGREPLAIAEILRQQGLRAQGRAGLLARREAADEALGPRREGDRATRLDRAIDGAREEATRATRQLDRLLGVVAARPPADRRVLIWVAQGFDLDPDAAWRAALLPEDAADGGIGLPRREDPGLAASVRDTGRALAALGWRVWPLAPESSADDDIIVPTTLAIDNPLDDEDAVNRGAGITIRPGRLLRRAREGAAASDAPRPATEVFRDAETARLRLAEAAGDRPLGAGDAVETRLGRTIDAVRVRYRSPLSDDAGLAPLAVALAPESAAATAGGDPPIVRASGWTTRRTPSIAQDARLARLLRAPAPDARGVLDVAGELRLREDLAAPGGRQGVELDARAGLGPRGEDGAALRGPLRMTLAVLDDDGNLALATAAADVDPTADPSADADSSDRADASALPFGASLRDDPLDGAVRRLLDETLRASDADAAASSSGLQLATGTDAWRWQRAMAVDDPALDGRPLALLVEEVTTGRWGATLLGVVRDGGEGLGAIQRAAVRIERPERELLRGRVPFTVRPLRDDVARVVLLLDGDQAAAIDQPPFTARLDLGRDLRRRVLSAVAYDADGAELGRELVVLNGGALAVDIVSPTRAAGTGPVTVEAEIAVPLENRLDRVLFFWNDEAVATRFAPPYRQTVLIPEDAPVGFVRVVAMLDDGTLAEDVLLLNGPDSAAQIDVNLVELNVVVTDREGRPVQGLTEADFAVFEDGTPRSLATFSDAENLPLTVGLAIDSSASMFVKMPRVQRAAGRFLRSIFEDQDRGFIVDIDTQPRLARSIVDELPPLLRAIDDLAPDGRTALWESVVFSLVHLQGVRGRKALIVFSDGADEDDAFPFRNCLRMARRMGVPIYLILLKEAPDEGDEGLLEGLWNRAFDDRADQLVSAVGGRVYYADDVGDLDGVYDAIENELRSQYLLAYYAEDGGAGAAGDWRRVRVEVDRPGLKPRTLTGYWP